MRLQSPAKLLENLLCRDGFDGTFIEFSTAALYFLEPSRFRVRIRRTIELLQEHMQKPLLRFGWKTPNLVLNLCDCSRHAG